MLWALYRQGVHKKAEMKKFIISLLLFIPSIVPARDMAAHEAGIWSIAPTDTMKRWVVIHNLKEALSSGVFHIEVLGRKNADPVWRVVHLVPHMAITGPALERGIDEPLSKGRVYPETYEDAYASWLKENNGKGGAVCETSLLECM